MRERIQKTQKNVRYKMNTDESNTTQEEEDNNIYAEKHITISEIDER